MISIPVKGVYYHYKHDPNGEINNFAYEVLGVAQDTETGKFSVVYKPLYKIKSQEPIDFFVRPLKMFNEEIEVSSKLVRRFSLVTDLTTLRLIREAALIELGDTK